jgi:hypothetical protein
MELLHFALSVQLCELIYVLNFIEALWYGKVLYLLYGLLPWVVCHMFLLLFSFVELLVDDIFQRLIEGIYIYMLIGWFSYALFCL